MTAFILHSGPQRRGSAGMANGRTLRALGAALLAAVAAALGVDWDALLYDR